MNQKVVELDVKKMVSRQIYIINYISVSDYISNFKK